MNRSNTKHGYCRFKMTLKDFSFILFLLLSANTFAQVKISGTVTANGQRLSFIEILNKTDGNKSQTDKNGNFAINVSKSGDYSLVFYSDNYAFFENIYSAPSENIQVSLEKINNLSEVVVQKQKEKIFALNKLKDIEETAIYAGKKSEVIAVGQLTANKATNNTRQIFAQVVGLTINEGSDGGLQLSIGGRGLDPNRTSNFNTRQNGYDISADVLGYPESYYVPPTEALDEIQVVRGAASLQYGTQFGGLVNFKLKSPSQKPISVVLRNTVGSYGLYTNFTSLSGTTGKFSYYAFSNYKKGDGFRPNSDFESKNFFANLNYQFNDKTSLHFDYTYFNYLAHQAGGLTDRMFYENPRQSNRERNWFKVDWNLFALRFKHQFTADANFSLQLFGLDASRKTVGFRPNRSEIPDNQNQARDLISGDFKNWGAEARYLQSYNLGVNKSTLLIGAKYYQSDNSGFQGPGSSGSDADFNLATTEFPYYKSQSDYKYPNKNIAVFGENIFRITHQFSITPGFRFEKIRTEADGYFRVIGLNLSETEVISDRTEYEDNVKDREFVLFGIGLSYKPKNKLEFYGNLSQNYRSITFNDIRTAIPNQRIAAGISDEKGYTSDIGFRGQLTDEVTFDASVFGLYYDDKIGEYDIVESQTFKRIRDNIGTAVTYGFEMMVDWNLARTFFKNNENFVWNVFSNTAFTGSEYLESYVPSLYDFSVKGNEVEFVPLYNIKAGTGIGYKNFKTSLQLTYLSSQFTTANNDYSSKNSIGDGITGQIPSYYVADFSASYKWKMLKLEAGINNFTDNKYFTRRASGYPGPGIIPSDFRNYYTTLEIAF